MAGASGVHTSPFGKVAPEVTTVVTGRLAIHGVSPAKLGSSVARLLIESYSSPYAKASQTKLLSIGLGESRKSVFQPQWINTGWFGSCNGAPTRWALNQDQAVKGPTPTWF